MPPLRAGASYLKPKAQASLATFNDGGGSRDNVLLADATVLLCNNIGMGTCNIIILYYI